MSELRDKTYEAAKEAIARVSMFDPGERSPGIDKMLARDGRAATKAVVKEIVDWLKERENDMDAKPRDWLLIAQEIECEFEESK